MKAFVCLRVITPALLVSLLLLVGCNSKSAQEHRSTSTSSQSSQTQASSSPPQPSPAPPPPPPPQASPPPPAPTTAEKPTHRSAKRAAHVESHGSGYSRTAQEYEHQSNLAYERRSEEAQISSNRSIDISPGARAAPPGADYEVVRVFYATDRQTTGDTTPSKVYGGDRQLDESLHLGTVDVSIPRDHRMGHIERPAIWKFEFHETPGKDVELLSVVPKSEQEFYADLATQVQSSANKDAFVFIHGFDNTFEQAAWRTAQMAYDLRFQGAPIMYSWPSKGKLAEYTADEATIDWATPHLEKFLETVATESHATTVHLIAHSMGNRALTRALTSMAQKRAGVPPMFQHVFLAAPDIDVGVFRQLAATFPSIAHDVTLYASSRDEAIAASEKLHQFDRVGDSTHICVVPKIDTIDATAVDTGLIGHAYYGDKRSILADMFTVMQTGSPPAQRFGMHAATLQQMTYWVMTP